MRNYPIKNLICKIFGTLILGVTCLTGCSIPKNTEPSAEVYREEVHLIQEQFLGELSLWGSVIYALDGTSADNQGKCTLLKLDTKNIHGKQTELFGEECEVYAAPDSMPMAMFAGGTDRLYLAAEIKAQEEYRLYAFDRQGNMLLDRDISEIAQVWAGQGIGMGAVKAAASLDGTVYFSLNNNDGQLVMYSDVGDVICEMELEETNILAMAGSENGVYVAGNKQNRDYLYYISSDMKSVRELMKLPQSKGVARLCVDAEGVLYYSTYDKLYKCDVEKQTTEAVYDWTAIGRVGNDVLSIHGGEKIYALMKKENNCYAFIALYSPASETMEEGQAAEKDKRIEIVINGEKEDLSLKKLAGKFNSTNDTYKVVVREYERERLLTELAAGSGPDLVSSAVNFQACVEKGLLEDLSPYLESSQLLHREDLISGVLDAYTYKGILTSIPPHFSIQNVYGKESELGTVPGWTTEEFLAYIGKQPERTLMEGLTMGESKNIIIIQSWWAQQDEWVNWDSHTASFDSEEFVELLYFAKEYDAVYDELVFEKSTEERWRDGEIHLLNSAIWGLEDYMSLKDVMGGDIVPIGYPAYDGAVEHRIYSQYSYAISSASQNKAGAWTFLEFLILHQELYFQGVASGIPTLTDAYEQSVEEDILKRNGSLELAEGDVRGEEGRFKVSAEDLLYFEEMIEKIAYAGAGSSVVESILLEEIAPCFSGVRTPEETAKVIQNRVQLYLDEM